MNELSTDYEAFVRPRVLQMLRAVRMNVSYHRAEGDYLYHREDGQETAVLDLLGGFGATLFGHNHPAIVASAQSAFAANLPFHAQASVRSRAASLGKRLSELVGRTTGRCYVTTFANSGAEAVEAALKHGGAEYANRLEAALREIRESVTRSRAALRGLEGRQLQALLGAATAAFGAPVDSLERLLERVQSQAERLSSVLPVVWALRRGFHGKTSGALRLTYNPKFRALWSFLGSAVFLDPDDADALPNATRAANHEFLTIETGLDGSFLMKRSSLSTVLACFVEPIQGEGGIWEIQPALATKIRACADEGGFPLVFDEIQSGLGRSGTFLASEALGVVGDYYLLSKSLGGGVAKISAMMVDRSRYVDEFGYLHTSTFSEDDWSCEVALSALDLLEHDKGRAYQLCVEKGLYFRNRLERIRARFPGAIRQIRGRGLMLGVEFETKRRWNSRLIRVLLEQDLLGYMIAGYLLREKRIRVAPALSANTTLRLEPSLYISEAEMERVGTAIEQVVALLHADDAREFARFLVLESPPEDAVPASRLALRSTEPEVTASGAT